MKNLLIATIKGMIEKDDVKVLEKFCNVDWLVQDKIDEIELAEKSKNYDYLMLNFDIVESLSEKFYNIVAGSKLKAISADITGMSWASPKTAKEKGIKLFNTSNYCTESVAEYIITQILMYAKQMHSAYNDVIKGEAMQGRKTVNVLNKTIGVVGLGNIGTRVAELASGLGMKVVAYNRTPKQIKNVEMVDLKTLFEQSDFISLCLKTVAGKTEGIVDKDLIKLCKPSCFIENQGGSKLVNKDDLKFALENKLIAGYGATLGADTIDFMKMENVLLHPANAWLSDESLENLKNIWMSNIVEFEKGNIINLVEE